MKEGFIISGVKNKKQLTYEETHKMEGGKLFKLCSICEEWFPCTTEYFYKNKSSLIDSLHTYCKTCARNKQIKYQTEHKEIQSERHKKWRQDKGEILNKRTKDWIKDNNEQWKEYMSNYQQEHPEKIKQYTLKRANKDHKINKEEWESCLDYFNNSCAYCGISNKEAKFQQGNYLHKEHVNHEGDNDLSNCVPSCKSCNSQKWEFTIDEWYNENNIKFNQERLNKIHKWLNEDYKLYIEEKKDLPYIIKRVKNKDNNKFHFELWSINENEERLNRLAISNKKKDLNTYIDKYFNIST